MRQFCTANKVAFKSLLTVLRGAAEGTLKVMHAAAAVLLRLSNKKGQIWKVRKKI